MFNLLWLENNILKQCLVSPMCTGIIKESTYMQTLIWKISVKARAYICGDAKNTQAHFDSKVLKKSYNLQFLKSTTITVILQSTGLEIFSIKFLTCEPNTFPSLSYLIHHMLHHFLKICVSVSVHADVWCVCLHMCKGCKRVSDP